MKKTSKQLGGIMPMYIIHTPDIQALENHSFKWDLMRAYYGSDVILGAENTAGIRQIRALVLPVYTFQWLERDNKQIYKQRKISGRWIKIG